MSRFRRLPWSRSLVPLGPRRFPFVTLSLAPLVKVRAPAFSICHASAGPLWSGPVAGPLRAPAFPIRRGCVDDFLNFLIGSLGAPAFSICHAFAGPLDPTLSLIPLGPRRFPFVAVALMFREFSYWIPWALTSYINLPQSYWQMCTGSGAILRPSLLKMFLKR